MRSIRRAFAAPLVLIAPLAACESHGHTMNPPPPPPPEHTHNPPAPVVNDPPPPADAAPDVKPVEPPHVIVNPPPPGPAPIPEVNPKDRHWSIAKKDGKCTAFFDDACKDPNRKPGDPIPPCNPPIPTSYPCQKGQADDFKIVKHDGADKCFVAQFQCPANAKCKPLPPPTEVPCP